MLHVRRIGADDEAGLEAYLAIRNAVTPTSPDSLEQIRWVNATYPAGGARFLAEVDGTPVGTAITGRIRVRPAEYERYWLGLWVLPELRDHGVGTALYAAVSDAAREAGKTGFMTELSERYESGHRFLARRGFVEVERAKQVRLELAGVAEPAVDPPAGIALTTLEARPDLLAGVHAVAVEAFADIPTADTPADPGPLDEFAARDVRRPGIPLDAFMIALDDVTGEVAGYASLMLETGSTTVAYHDMTAVRHQYRGRGLASALKRATIAWGLAHGLAALETSNDEHNAPMRAVNARLGYRPIPDLIALHGPLATDRTGILQP